MCVNRKIEYGCSENKPFGVAYNKCAERLFLWNFVRGEVMGCTQKYVQINEGMIDGAMKFGNTWAIPKDAVKPADKRIKSGKYIKF